VLVATCTGVSFAHGSNDGQKGMGLIMLVLIGIVPASYALDLHASSADLARTAAAARRLEAELSEPTLATLLDALKGEYVASARVERLARTDAVAAAEVLEANAADLLGPEPADDVVLATLDPLPLAREVVATLDGLHSFRELEAEERWRLRTRLVELGASVRTLLRHFGDTLAEDRRRVLAGLAGQIARPVEYVPVWVVIGVALCLGLGTMFGWERIVVTVGEKIGKSHLSYAQGAAAEVVAASTIGLADALGMPVSTTHVLSSGIAGTMWAGRSGIQSQTVRQIVLAWVLTLPAVILLSGGCFWLATRFLP
jgi:phosphate/sulfate permease